MNVAPSWSNSEFVLVCTSPLCRPRALTRGVKIPCSQNSLGVRRIVVNLLCQEQRDSLSGCFYIWEVPAPAWSAGMCLKGGKLFLLLEAVWLQPSGTTQHKIPCCSSPCDCSHGELHFLIPCFGTICIFWRRTSALSLPQDNMSQTREKQLELRVLVVWLKSCSYDYVLRWWLSGDSFKHFNWWPIVL